MSADTVRDLRAALADALEGLEEMIGYVPEYFQEKWEHQGFIDRAKEALGSEDTESCRLCRKAATGVASIGEIRYCDDGPSPTCYEQELQAGHRLDGFFEKIRKLAES